MARHLVASYRIANNQSMPGYVGSNDIASTTDRGRHQRCTIGVFCNRQVYIGTTISRYQLRLLSGIRAAALANDCNLLLACGVEPDASPVRRLPAWPIDLPHTNFVPVGPWNASGLIAVPPFTDPQQHAIRELLPQGYPIVFTYPQEGYPSVAPTNSAGIEQAFAHLVSHGHRRIVFIAQEPDAGGDGAERLAAYRAAVAARGLPFDSALVGWGRHNAQESYQAIWHMLSVGLDFTAVLASNDGSAIGVLQALADAGRRVPEDVAVIGFDNLLEATAQSPPLTTVRHPTFELGYQAVELLLDYITGRRSELATVRLPTRLVVRESCGCRPHHTPILEWPAATVSDNRAGATFDLYALIRGMSDAVSAEAQHVSVALIGDGCQSLATAFLASLDHGEPGPFTAALDHLLQQAEELEEDAYCWQAAISVLRAHLGAVLAVRAPATPRGVAESLIDQAGVQIGDCARRQHTRFQVRQAKFTERLGMMTTRLLTALEPQQILDTLVEHLPQIGIRHAHVALFQAEGDDPVAWSNLYVRSAVEALAVQRFHSRQFPPPGLYDPAEPFSLALLPLIIDGGNAGFVAFDAANLEPCGLIVRHLAAAFRNSQLHAAAEEGRRQAEEANKLKSQLLSTVSHELRTPLSLIVLLSQMLLRDRNSKPLSSAAVMGDIERILETAQHLGDLIGDVLDLVSSEAGHLRLYQEPLDLPETLQVVILTGARMAGEKGLAWHAQLPPAGPWVRGDPTRLRQVALNLICNAVKFTEHGEITLDMSIARDEVTVSISDTGPGVSLSEQEEIFDEFRTSARTAGRAYGGWGLGLAICKQLIERHGGRIGVRSSGEQDGGATFFFTLPLVATSAPPVEAVPGLPADHLLVVLLTEPEEIGDPLGATLRERGFDVQVQRIDAEAAWLSRLIAAPPGALILDGALATRRVWEIRRLLKRHPVTAHIPVLIYALDPRDDRGALLELDYLLKPLDPEQLAYTLAQQWGWADQPAGAKTILVVDDDPDTLALQARLIREQPGEWRVVQARNGREALALMEQRRPHLVLLDLMMPEMDGFQVLEAMRARESTTDVPVVVLTAHQLTEEDMARLNAGVEAILSKGLFSADEILGRIESALAHHRSLNRATQQVVRRAAAFIHTHYAEPITRDQLAAHVGFSADHLTTCFRQEMGVTPIVYLNRYRISRARTLLEESSRGITDIARDLGFGDLTRFSREFRREVGMAPRAYRRSKQH